MSNLVYRAKIAYSHTSVIDEITHVFDRLNIKIERGYGRILDLMADYVIKRMEL